MAKKSPGGPTALNRLALERSAKGKMAPVKLAPERSAPVRVASYSQTPVRSASDRLAPDRSVPDLSQLCQSTRGAAGAAQLPYDGGSGTHAVTAARIPSDRTK